MAPEGLEAESLDSQEVGQTEAAFEAEFFLVGVDLAAIDPFALLLLGVKRRLGKIQETPIMEGVKVYNPFLTRIIRVPIRTMNIEVRSPLPSKEGLTVQSDISILYRVEGTQAPQIIEKLGAGYEEVVILPLFRSAVTDISSRYFAKDMHTGQRAGIEKEIKELNNLGPSAKVTG